MIQNYYMLSGLAFFSNYIIFCFEISSEVAVRLENDA